jgi:hypothetical protein
MIWKTLQASPPTPAIRLLKREAAWILRCQFDKPIQLIPKLVAQPIIEAIVMAQNPRNITLNGRVAGGVRGARGGQTPRA